MAAGVKQTIGQRVREFFAGVGRPVAEMIGRMGSPSFKNKIYQSTIDRTVPDYEFWDKFRRGKLSGYKLGSLFAKRIERIFARWVFSNGLEVKLADEDIAEETLDYTNGQLADFVGTLLDAGAGQQGELEDKEETTGSLLMQVYEDHLGLGDQYVVVNADATLSIPSPDTVTVECDELDYRQVNAVEIETRTDKYTIIDRYEPAVRTVTIKQGTGNQKVETYANLLGVIPVVHIAHGRSANETNGHSIHEPLLPLCSQYDDVVYKQMDGAKLLGNPLLTFEGMEDINQVINANEPAETDEYTDKDGNTADRPQLMVDRNAILLVGKGGTAKFTSPAVGFTADTTQALKSLFLLLLDHTGIPEFIWGNELSSARASAEVQLDQWVQDISGMQHQAGGWILRLCALWLRTKALLDPALVVGGLMLEWPPLIEKDEALRLQQIQIASDKHWITDATGLRLLNIVENPDEEVEAAQQEAQEQYDKMFPAGSSPEFRGDLNQAQQEAETETETEEGSP